MSLESLIAAARQHRPNASVAVIPKGSAILTVLPAPCVHGGTDDDIIQRCPTCNGGARHVRECAVHEKCTWEPVNPAVMDCAKCRRESLGYEPVPTAPVPVDAIGLRHLLYHVLPVAGNGVWQQGIRNLRERWMLFTGRKIIAVATGKTAHEQESGNEIPLDLPAVVRAALPADAEVVEVPNDPQRWELASWPALWRLLLGNAADADVVLYAHAKGVTRPQGSPAHGWADMLYRLSMDYWPRVEAELKTKPICGPLLRHGEFFGEPCDKSKFHYSGNFWWGRVGPLKAALARVPVPVDRWASEAWLGLAFAPTDAGDIWTPKGYDFYLYDWPAYNRVTADFVRWMDENPPQPRAGRTPTLTIVVPTAGRETLTRTLASITPQLQPHDQVIVQRDQSNDWGATPRTRGMNAATGDYILFMDDDDVYTPHALEAVRAALEQNPGRPHLFRLRRDGGVNDVLPTDPAVRLANVSTQMVVVPNDKPRFGTWGVRYEGDYDFISSTLARYPAGAVIFRPEVLAIWRPDAERWPAVRSVPAWWSHEPHSIWDWTTWNDVVQNDEYRMTLRDMRGATMLDIGAHIGCAAYQARMLGAELVHCYEPDAVSRAHLENNARQIGGVVVHPEAVGAVVSEMGQPGRVIGDGAKTVDLDTALIRLGRRCDLLKIDAEGAEYPALSGLTRWDLLGAVAGEFHVCKWAGRQHGISDITAFFAKAGRTVRFVRSKVPERGLFFSPAT